MRALGRGLEVLRYLREFGPETGPNIARCLGLSRATVGRIVVTLQHCDLVTLDDETKLVSLAPGFYEISSGMTDEARALWVATPVIYDLQRELLWPTCLATQESGKIVICETTHRVSPYSIDTRMEGTRHSLFHGSLGRAYLGFSDEEQLGSLLHESNGQPDDVRDPAYGSRLERLISRIREQGFACRNMGTFPKTSSIAVPIRVRGKVVASMNVVWIASALKFGQAAETFYPALSEAQNKIEQTLSAQAQSRLDAWLN